MIRWQSTDKGAVEAIFYTTLICGYMFFIDISHKIWWSRDQIFWTGWDYFSVKPLNHTVDIEKVTEVSTANHPANWIPGRPFDRITLVSPSDAITILPSFHRREEIEKLLQIVHSKQHDANFDPQAREFMEGGFVNWWPYR